MTYYRKGLFQASASCPAPHIHAGIWLMEAGLRLNSGLVLCWQGGEAQKKPDTQYKYFDHKVIKVITSFL